MKYDFQGRRTGPLASGLLLAALVCAPTAHAGTSWAAITYHSGSNGVETSWYRNYSNQTDLIFQIQKEFPDWGYQTFRSGKCGAVASFEDPFGDTKFGTGVADDRDAAVNEAINDTYGGRYKVEQAFCQG